MILYLRNSIVSKGVSLLLIFTMIFTIIVPFNSLALTGGPAQPEFNSFTPIGTSDMVDLTSGDFSYNIPLMDIGGFPINLAYSSGITTDQEASWVGLGWNLSIGQINRQMRGIPDDFDGSKEEEDRMVYENNIKNNYTVGAGVTIRPTLFGLESQILSFGVTAQYNSYAGISISPSIGASFDLGSMASVGLNVTSSPDGLTVSPNLSLHGKMKNKQGRENNIGSSVGISFNSRQGLSNFNLSASRSSYLKSKKNTKSGGFKASGSIGSSISFVDNHYTPTIQNGITSQNFTFNAAIDGTFFGVDVGSQIRAFGSQQYISANDQVTELRAFGYDNNHLANGNDIRDFNREKDGNYSVNSTNLSLTNQTYDIYSVQGQGVSGMFRPYRSKVGYVTDNKKTNTSVGASLGVEAGLGNLFRVGADVEVSTTNTESGEWSNSNQAKQALDISSTSSADYEEVYYKNVGDLAVDEETNIFGDASSFSSTTSLGGYQPIRIKLAGSEFNRSTVNSYEIKNINAPQPDFYSSSNTFNSASFKRNQRVKRNQNILKVSAGEISNPDGNLLGFFKNSNAKDHHTAGFIVTRNDGASYIYGEALYNTEKKEVSFAVGKPVGQVFDYGNPSAIQADIQKGLVPYNHGVDNTVNNTKGDHYYNKVVTPDYAHTFLLTALLSTDYSDVDDIPGPSDNDLGSYTTFKYKSTNSSYQWRVPYGEEMASYNEGLRTDRTDDKGSYVYGKKETKYIEIIETKTHIAIFKLSPRADGVGANEDGSMDVSSKMYKIEKISLYSKEEYDGLGAATNSTPIKEVHFEYTYELCKGIPNYKGSIDAATSSMLASEKTGKLTLKKVYFTYRNSKMGKYNSYDFTYGDIDHNGVVTNSESTKRNPNYNLKAYNIWSSYMPNNGAGNTMDIASAPEYNYVDQEDSNVDDYSSAWSITDIGMPSGGIIKIDYESDDYEFVQDKKAMRMFKVVGTGTNANGSGLNSSGSSANFNALDNSGNSTLSTQTNGEALLFQNNISKTPNNYLYVQLDDAELNNNSFTTSDFKREYVDQILDNQEGLMYFRFFVNMTSRGGSNSSWNSSSSPFEYITGYAKISNVVADYGVFEMNDHKYGAIPLVATELESGLFQAVTYNPPANPISVAAWNFGRKYLQKYVYEINSPADNSDPEQLVNSSIQAIENIKELIKGPNKHLRDKLVGRRFIPEKSWIRLCNPRSLKKGGGIRVKRIVMTDEWAKLSATADDPYNPNATDDIRDQKYGQDYIYKLENGRSSGVATYEPIGSKENPLVQPSFVTEERLLAPDEENYVEKPFGESFYPSPTITYSRVAVKNIERRIDPSTPNDDSDDLVVKRHATGYVVTEHYTSKDYPTIVDQTPLQIFEDKTGFLAGLLSINARKHMTLTQGYVVHLNDMNGKKKSERIYGEDQTVAISGADYIYEDNTVASLNGYSNKGKLNNRVQTLSPAGSLTQKTIGLEYDVVNDFREMKSLTQTIGVNGNFTTFLIGFFPGFVPVPLPDYSRIEDKLNIVTTTKVINTFGIQREVIAYDLGAKVKTKNLLWDSYTGEVLLTQTVNEYDDYYYSFNYPAYWSYSEMGMACLNSGIEFGFTTTNSPFQTSAANNSKLVLGDEVIVGKINLQTGKRTYLRKGWVTNKPTAAGFELQDKNGGTISLTAISSNETHFIRVVRSGNRNLQTTSMGSLVLMDNPILQMSDFLSGVWASDKVINAGIVEFSDEWDRQCECGLDNSATRNEFVQNEKGVWRAKESKLYLTGRTQDSDPTPRKNGFFLAFNPYYVLNSSEWVKTTSANLAKWTATSEVTQYSQFGIELENKDALNRYSSAQYGYNYMFPMAVSANSQYGQMGFDGFEDYDFEGCSENEHFGFRDRISPSSITNAESHTGKNSLKVQPGQRITKLIPLGCP